MIEEIFRRCTIRSFTKKCSTTFGYGQPCRAQRRRPGRVRRVSRISGAMSLAGQPRAFERACLKAFKAVSR
jgi:hypothetical protein